MTTQVFGEVGTINYQDGDMLVVIPQPNNHIAWETKENKKLWLLN